MLCQYCNIDFNETLRSHIKKHNLTIKDYYDLFYKKENEGKCLTCGKETCFITFKIGYRKYCSNICAGNNKETILLRKKTKLKNMVMKILIIIKNQNKHVLKNMV